MSFSNVRNYFAERAARIQYEWQQFQKSRSKNLTPHDLALDSDTRRLFHEARDRTEEKYKKEIYDTEFNHLLDSLRLKNLELRRPFEFSAPLEHPLPENRIPAPGIRNVPRRFHPGQIVTADSPYLVDPTTDLPVPETGFEVHPLISHLVRSKYPSYWRHVLDYVRPLGTTDATFADFNREQIPSAPIEKERKDRCLKHVHRLLSSKRYLPLHALDTPFAGLPLHTGTGYHNRHSFRIRTHAKFSRPEEYAQRTTSKGYFYNAFWELARTQLHRIKDSKYALPVPFEFEYDDSLSADDNYAKLAESLSLYYDNHATMLFTRNHISQRDGALKQRPVYAVDEMFILIEVMLTFPLLVMARRPDCCIMYGLETIRGAMHHIDYLATHFKSFFTIDWSQYDQRLPWQIVDLYYTEFLESLIVISHGYQPTWEYPTYPDLNEHDMFKRMSNLLFFLRIWYKNMTFVTADGYAYRRTYCGVPSGLFNTQYLDSFGNIFLIVDGLIEFGCSDDEIAAILLFVMGDDNSGMTLWPLSKLHKFIKFFEEYALRRWNMVLSKTKSVITILREKIELLSYSCNFGRPLRPIPKLVAQLCYPERGPKDKYTSYRAIGLAYAAAGMDRTFHAFCRDVYLTFLPYAAPLDEHNFPFVQRFLPGYLKAPDLAENLELGKFDAFPTLQEVRKVYDHYHGPLDYAPKWNFAHFMCPPDACPPDSLTMREYRIKYKIPCPNVPVLPIIG